MCRSTRTVVALLLALLVLVLAAEGQLPSNPYYGNGLMFGAKNPASPFVYANTASYANTYYLPYAYSNYAPYSPIRT